MLLYIPGPLKKAFRENLEDWLAGGPKDGGWTRTGPTFPTMRATLVGYRYVDADIDDVLSKNAGEVDRWHVGFLRDHSVVEDTPYYKEYLHPRYGDEAGQKAVNFLNLYEDIEQNGVREPVWLADVPGIGPFRFDGCHRAAAAKVLGLRAVPAIFFTAELVSDDA